MSMFVRTDTHTVNLVSFDEFGVDSRDGKWYVVANKQEKDYSVLATHATEAEANACYEAIVQAIAEGKTLFDVLERNKVMHLSIEEIMALEPGAPITRGCHKTITAFGTFTCVEHVRGTSPDADTLYFRATLENGYQVRHPIDETQEKLQAIYRGHIPFERMKFRSRD